MSNVKPLTAPQQKTQPSKPSFRYLATESNVAAVSFDVWLGRCGTVSQDINATRGGSSSSSSSSSTSTSAVTQGSVFSNVIVIQNDGVVQEMWDSAHRLTCRWSPDQRLTKTVSVRPLNVGHLDTLDVHDVAADDSDADLDVDVWMELQNGRWPAAVAVDESAIRIGQTLSLVVGVAGGGRTDLQVRDCHAHSTADLRDPAAFRVQLTDERGCVLKPKLLTPFSRQRGQPGTPRAGHALNVAFLTAFSFPDNVQVFTSCNVEVCRGRCPQSEPCQPGVPPSSSTTSFLAPPSLPSTTQAPPTLAPSTTPTAPRTTTTSTTTTTPPPPPPPPVPRSTSTTLATTQASTSPPASDYLPPTSSPVDDFPPVPPPTELSPPPPVFDAPPPVFDSAPAALARAPALTFPLIPELLFPPVPTSTSTAPPPLATTARSDAPLPSLTFPPPVPTPTSAASSALPGLSLIFSRSPVAPPTSPAPSTTTQRSTPSNAPSPTTAPVYEVFQLPPTPATARPPPRCFPGSSNPLCPTRRPFSAETRRSRLPTPPNCPFGSRDARCFESARTKTSPVTSTCLPGSTNPLCARFRPLTTTATPSTPLTASSAPSVAPQQAASQERPFAAPRPRGAGSSERHAFHMFHFQRGDGRRGRFLATETNDSLAAASSSTARKIKRQSDPLWNGRQMAQVRLTRSVRVLPVQDVGDRLDFEPPTVPLVVTGFDAQQPVEHGQYCLSVGLVAGLATATSAVLVLLIAASIFLAQRYVHTRRQLNKVTAAQFRLSRY